MLTAWCTVGAQDKEKYRFLSKFFSKSNDFDRPAWPGVAVIEKVSIFIEIPFKNNDVDCPGWPGAAWGALFVNPTEYSFCREHYYGRHSEGPGGVL